MIGNPENNSNTADARTTKGRKAVDNTIEAISVTYKSHRVEHTDRNAANTTTKLRNWETRTEIRISDPRDSNVIISNPKGR
mgnify:CR=1 FL=1